MIESVCIIKASNVWRFVKLTAKKISISIQLSSHPFKTLPSNLLDGFKTFFGGFIVLFL
jgi:hypothetical protein